MGSISWLLFKLMWIQQCEMRNAYTFISHKTLTTDVKWSWLLWFTLSDKWCTRAYLNDLHSFRNEFRSIWAKPWFAFSKSNVDMTLLFKSMERAICVWFSERQLIEISLFQFVSNLFFLSLESFLSHNIFVCLCAFSIYITKKKSAIFPLELWLLFCCRSDVWNQIEFTVVWDDFAYFRTESNSMILQFIWESRVWVEIKKKFFFERRFVRNANNFLTHTKSDAMHTHQNKLMGCETCVSAVLCANVIFMLSTWF